MDPIGLEIESKCSKDEVLFLCVLGMIRGVDVKALFAESVQEKHLSRVLPDNYVVSECKSTSSP